MTSYTTNLRLNVPVFDEIPWDEEVNTNWTILDAAVGMFVTVPNLAGVWTNSHDYLVGQTAIDGVDSSMWFCLVAHTSSSAPTTFSTERAFNPTLWTQSSGSAQFYAQQAASSATAAQNSANDAAAAAASVGDVVHKYGDTMTGELVLFGDPTVPLGAATKQFVEGITGGGGSGYLALTGGTMTGPLILSGSPTIASHAANKAYVDAHSGGGTGVDHWVFVTDHGAVGDGTTDDSAAINAAIAFAAPGQEVWLSPTGRHFCASTIAVLKGRVLRGAWNVPGNTNPGNVALDLTTLNGALILSTGATVQMDSGSGIKGVPIYRQGLVTPAASSAAFGGTGITINGDDVYVGYCLIMGFATGISSTSGGSNSWVRQKIEWVYGDNNNGIVIDNSRDTPYISHCHFWPFTSISPSATMAAHQRTGTAFNITNSDLISLSHNFCIAYQTGYHVGQDGGAFLLDCQADGIINGATGFQFDTGIEGTRAMGCVAYGAAGSTASMGYLVNVPVQDYMEFTACYANSCTTAYQIQSGDCKISGGTVDRATIAVGVASASSIVSLCGGFRAEVIATAVVNNTGGGSGVYIDPDCDFSRINLGGGSAAVSSTMQPIIIASASPMFLPHFFDVFQISGTTGFGILNNGWAGRKVKLIFSSVLTVFHSGTSGGIALVGQANVTTYTGMVLDLVHNGFQWFEAGHPAPYTGNGASLTSPGWRRNADGSIENWASVTTNSSGVGTFSFSQPFSNFLLSVQATAQTAGDANVCVTVGTQSLSSIPIYAANGSTGVGLVCGVFCHAIGR